MTLVSTASMPAPYLSLDPGAHFIHGLRWTLMRQAAENLVGPGWLEQRSRFQQHTFRGVFDHEPRPGVPMPASADFHRQNDLSFGGHRRGELVCGRHVRRPAEVRGM